MDLSIIIPYSMAGVSQQTLYSVYTRFVHLKLISTFSLLLKFTYYCFLLKTRAKKHQNFKIKKYHENLIKNIQKKKRKKKQEKKKEESLVAQKGTFLKPLLKTISTYCLCFLFVWFMYIFYDKIERKRKNERAIPEITLQNIQNDQSIFRHQTTSKLYN